MWRRASGSSRSTTARIATWRRVVVRGDGCGTSACSGSAIPNVGITIYDSADVSFQNRMVIDRVLAVRTRRTRTLPARAAHGGAVPVGPQRVAGDRLDQCAGPVAVLRAGQRDPGATSATIRDALLWRMGGLNLARQGRFDVSRVWTKARSDDAFRVAPELAGSGSTVSNVVATGTGRYGLNTLGRREQRERERHVVGGRTTRPAACRTARRRCRASRRRRTWCVMARTAPASEKPATNLAGRELAVVAERGSHQGRDVAPALPAASARLPLSSYLSTPSCDGLHEGDDAS